MVLRFTKANPRPPQAAQAGNWPAAYLSGFAELLIESIEVWNSSRGGKHWAKLFYCTRQCARGVTFSLRLLIARSELATSLLEHVTVQSQPASPFYHLLSSSVHATEMRGDERAAWKPQQRARCQIGVEGRGIPMRPERRLFGS